MYEFDNGNGYEDEGLDDERNRASSVDHRGPRGPRGPMGMVPFGNRRPARRPRPGYGGPSRPREVVIYQEAPAQPRSGLFGNLTTDEIVELAAQAFAAFQSLPAAPTATGDTKLDVENLITYQSALALHAKRDEQVRLIGSLAAKLLSK
jgi:hypothetical protein